jgi:hypothetical protein
LFDRIIDTNFALPSFIVFFGEFFDQGRRQFSFAKLSESQDSFEVENR